MLKSRFVVGLNAHNNPFLPIWRNHPNETLVEYWICSFLGAIWRVSNMTRGKESVVGIPAKIKILTGEHPTPTPHRVSWPWTPCAPQLRQETKKAPRPSSMWILETLERLRCHGFRLLSSSDPHHGILKQTSYLNLSDIYSGILSARIYLTSIRTFYVT